MLENLYQFPLLKLMIEYVETRSSEKLAEIETALAADVPVNEPSDSPPLACLVQLLSDSHPDGFPDLVEKLVDAGADPNATISFHKRPPLFSACLYGHDKVVQKLVQAGAKLDAKDAFFQLTPIEIAQKRNHLDIVELLQANGAALPIKSSGEKGLRIEL